MTRPIYIFAGGGTGGHLYPGLAVAEQLERLDRGAQVVFACSNRPIDRRILDPLDYPVVPQPVRPLPRNPKGWIGFLKAWRRSGAQAGEMIADLEPAAVLGLGGF
ncbi:MAG TPA: glycosyltransferase, partial [Phycisphaerae bacterium]|nr:glycosyltransferase [Phycisphaerae bacterium]